MSTQNYYYYRRPIVDSLETNMPDPKPIMDLDMLYWKPI